MGKNLAIKDYTNEIFKSNNHVHWNTYYKLIWDLLEVLYLPKYSHHIGHAPYHNRNQLEQIMVN